MLEMKKYLPYPICTKQNINSLDKNDPPLLLEYILEPHDDIFIVYI